ncbi:polysaccharide deacetylase family protein [Humitalea sp. 24SJ18S-53]|uniref:polysaccharide deacetylase family protein n=1 Tax=Humitalea sp. 24SJ18S-53 TaxID=3422307 RepID=UPI003D6649C4
MTMPDEYLQYPHRRAGMDQSFYEHSRLFERPAQAWPGGAPVALWITVHFDFFPMDTQPGPVSPIGGMEFAYPDYRVFTWRDYGNRVGAYRVMKVLRKHNLKASAVFNSAVAERYPRLLADVLAAGWEVIAGGVDMGRPLHGRLEAAEEIAIIDESLSTLRRMSGQPVRTWHSPAHSESFDTLHRLRERGVLHVADWVNDDMPYRMNTRHGAMLSLPLASEWADDYLMSQQHMTPPQYQRQCMDAFTALKAEAATRGGRVLSLPLHPWIIGQPHRIATLDHLLGDILKAQDTWSATAEDLATHFR